MRVFLSSTYKDMDREVVGHLETLLASHDVQIVTGRNLGGEGLTPEIMQRIEESDALVALMTRRDQLGEPEEGRWSTHPWVRDEMNHARGHQVRSIGLVEDGVDMAGAYDEREWIPFNRAAPLAAFLKLSETIWLWRQQLGRTRVARVSPDDLGRRFRQEGNLRCQYRFVNQDGDRTDWLDVEPRLAAGGTVIYLRGIRTDTDQVEVEVLESGRPRFASEATPQWLSIALEDLGG